MQVYSVIFEKTCLANANRYRISANRCQPARILKIPQFLYITLQDNCPAVFTAGYKTNKLNVYKMTGIIDDNIKRTKNKSDVWFRNDFTVQTDCQNNGWLYSHFSAQTYYRKNSWLYSHFFGQMIKHPASRSETQPTMQTSSKLFNQIYK